MTDLEKFKHFFNKMKIPFSTMDVPFQGYSKKEAREENKGTDTDLMLWVLSDEYIFFKGKLMGFRSDNIGSFQKVPK